MKIILGDNQFFGINHSDLEKAELVKKKFNEIQKIICFIRQSLKIGLDGFMINSNNTGYQIIKKYHEVNPKEIHYSIPYPHKYASMVNENGLLSLMHYFLKNTSFIKIIQCLPKFLLTRNLKYLVPIATSLEIPRSLPKGSTVYLQNILTDLIIGLKRIDIIEEFASEIRKEGFRVGIITLNPILLHNFIKKSKILNKSDLIVCFNINDSGFNVFPNKDQVENFIIEDKNYKLMGMSIFSSGASNIEKSINYIKKLNLDYIVFGSSNLKNIKKNFTRLRDTS